MGEIPMSFNRLSSLRDDQDRREVIYAKNATSGESPLVARGSFTVLGKVT
jgi:hypothetical protein